MKKATGLSLSTIIITLLLTAAGIELAERVLGIDLGTSQTHAHQTVDRSDACFMSQKFVKRNLRSPSTAEFPIWSEDNCRVTQDGNVWKVGSYVDAQNGFGATIRSDYGVEMRYNPGEDNWTLLDIMIVAR